MTIADLQALSPLIVVACTALVLLLMAAFAQNHAGAALVACGGNIVALSLLPSVANQASRPIAGLLLMDDYALLYMALIFAASAVVAVLSYDYLEKHRLKYDEYYILLVLATLGAAVLVASTQFVTFFLGLELLTVSLYVMIAYVFQKEYSLEAAIKYLILAATSSAFLLFGMALIYAELGSMDFSGVAGRLSRVEDDSPVVILAGTALMLTGIGFKLAVAPFHMWTPDVYQGAPAPVAAFVATVSKGAVVAFLLRYLGAVDGIRSEALFFAIAAIAVTSMLAGNVLALMQDNVKRIFAYSSIAHLGYLLVAVLAGGLIAIEAVTFYVITYVVSTLGVFGLIGFLSTVEREPDTLDDFRGLYRRNPAAAAIFTVMVLSLAGIPLTGGFLAKFFVLAAGVKSALWFLVLAVAVNSAIGLFYYLRILITMYAAEPAGTISTATNRRLAPAGAGVLLCILSVVVVGLGVYPKPVVELIQTTASVLIYE